MLLMQIRMLNAQWAQTNWNFRVWSKQKFTAGPCEERGGSRPEMAWAPWRVLAKHF